MKSMTLELLEKIISEVCDTLMGDEGLSFLDEYEGEGWSDAIHGEAERIAEKLSIELE